ncbi:Rha family transcriptional regulator [Kingella potus]|uniref:Rha family transcriptional regulator n=2 Tax=Kingella potus TaxID=265175 RepID=UPI001FD288F5|nr:Rha family transcriptional regulator [Kingella potus]UOP00515.1 Rha family transcriptional regulator [Kingella potus]
MNAVANFQDFVQVKHSQTVTTSEFIAQAFKKQHRNVLRDIENLLADIDPAFAAQNFKAVERVQKTGFGERSTRAYELTKDGFMLLVMGFTGKAALAIKIAYIQAFNTMAEMLAGRLKAESAPTSVDERTPLRQAVSALVGLRRVDYSTAYNMVHQRFGVEKIEDLPREILPDAVRYVHALTLDNALTGEVLERPDRPSEKHLADHEIHNLAVCLKYLSDSMDFLRPLSDSLRGLGSHYAGRAFSLSQEPHTWLHSAKHSLTRLADGLQDPAPVRQMLGRML